MKIVDDILKRHRKFLFLCESYDYKFKKLLILNKSPIKISYSVAQKSEPKNMVRARIEHDLYRRLAEAQTKDDVLEAENVYLDNLGKEKPQDVYYPSHPFAFDRFIELEKTIKGLECCNQYNWNKLAEAEELNIEYERYHWLSGLSKRDEQESDGTGKASKPTFSQSTIIYTELK